VVGLARKAVDGELTLRLPTIGDGPLASPEAGREPPAGKLALAAWRVPALVFEPSAAAEVLAVFGTAAESYPNAVAAATLAYLAVVARFAADLVARGRVLPVLVAEDDGYAARWRPVLGAADAQRARDLAAAMPPLCRAARLAVTFIHADPGGGRGGPCPHVAGVSHVPGGELAAGSRAVHLRTARPCAPRRGAADRS